jgi:NADH dehydrogenase
MAAKQALERLGVEVLIGKVATICDARGVVVVDAPSAVSADGKAHSSTVVASERIESCMIIWAAGVAASPAAKWLGAEKDRAGRVIVGPDLTLPRHPEIFVIGDTALAKSASGQPLPGIAPVAKQQGRYVANVIRARLSGNGAPVSLPPPWQSCDDRAQKRCRRFRLRLSGRLAWLLWGAVHIFFLMGFRNRIAVLLNSRPRAQSADE